MVWCLFLLLSLAETYDVVDFEVLVSPNDLETQRFTVEVRPDWAPIGAARLVELVEAEHFDDCAFFRVIDNFMVQFGISGNTTKQAAWRSKSVRDESERSSKSNARGTVTFAHAGKHTRSTQLFINFKDNKFLDAQGFPPIGHVIDAGMSVVDAVRVTGEGAPSGPGPSQWKIQRYGDSYLRTEFPQLSRIVRARLRKQQTDRRLGGGTLLPKKDEEATKAQQATTPVNKNHHDVASRSSTEAGKQKDDPDITKSHWRWLLAIAGALAVIGTYLFRTTNKSGSSTLIDDVEATVVPIVGLDKEN